MTVAELRAALEALPAGADTWTVVLGRDSNGLSYRRLWDIGRGTYAHEEGSGWIPLQQQGNINALLLWPEP